MIRERLREVCGLLKCALGSHDWVVYPPVKPSQFPAHNIKGEVVGSWVPTRGLIARTTNPYFVESPDRPVDPPKGITTYFQPTRDERPGYTQCCRCGDRV